MGKEKGKEERGSGHQAWLRIESGVVAHARELWASTVTSYEDNLGRSPHLGRVVQTAPTLAYAGLWIQSKSPARPPSACLSLLEPAAARQHLCIT